MNEINTLRKKRIFKKFLILGISCLFGILLISDNLKEKLVSYLEDELNNISNKKDFIKNSKSKKSYSIIDDTFDASKLNLTIKSFTFSLDEFRKTKNEDNIHLNKRSNNEKIIIRGLFQTSIPGLAETDMEKDLFYKLLSEWAPDNLINYSDITFELTFVNSSKQTTDYEKMVSQQLNGKNSKYDFFMIDSVWTGRYGEHLLDLQGKINSNSVKLYSEVNLNSCKYKKKITALPWYSDYGILLYRKDLLEKYNQRVPETWDQLEYIAEFIMEKESLNGNKDLEGYAGQFKSYEGLTCNIYEWIYSFRDTKDTVLDYFNDVSSLNALKKLISLLNKSIISTEALIYEEALSLERWEKGNILFMRNWPNAIQSTEETFNMTGTKFDFGVSKLPGRIAGLSAATLGGWNLGVSKYSNNPLLSAKVVEFLTGKYTQKQRALKFSLLPTIKELYYDKDVCNVIMCELYKDIQAINRPSNEENYLDYSEVIYTTIHKALENTMTADEAIRTIKKYTNVDYIDLSSPTTFLIVGITVFIQIGILFITIIIAKNRKMKFIQRSNPTYMFIILTGLFFQCFTIYTYVGKPSDNTCALRIWITHIPLTIVIMGIFAQSFRIYVILNNDKFKKIELFIKGKFLLLVILLVVAIASMILSVGQIYDPLLTQTKSIKIDSNEIEKYYICSGKENTSTIIYVILLIMNGIIIFSCTYITNKIKTVASDFYESTHVTYALYSIFAVNVALFLLTMTYLSNVYTMFYINSLIILLYVLFVTIIIFFPKMSSLYLYIERQKKKRKMKRRNVWKNGKINEEDYEIVNTDLIDESKSKKNKNKNNNRNPKYYRMYNDISNDDNSDDARSTTSSCFTNYSSDESNTLRGILLVRNSNNLNTLIMKEFERCKVVLIMDVKILSIELLLDSDVNQKIQMLYNKELNNNNGGYKCVNPHYLHSLLRDKRQIISMLNISLCREPDVLNSNIIRFVVEDLTWYEFFIEDDNEFRLWIESMEYVLKQNLNEFFGIDYIPKTLEDYTNEKNNGVVSVINQYTRDSNSELNIVPSPSIEINTDDMDDHSKLMYVMQHSINLGTSCGDYPDISYFKEKNSNSNSNNINLSRARRRSSLDNVDTGSSYSLSRGENSISNEPPYFQGNKDIYKNNNNNNNNYKQLQENEISTTNKLLKNYSNFSKYNNNNNNNNFYNNNNGSKTNLYNNINNKSSEELFYNNNYEAYNQKPNKITDEEYITINNLNNFGPKKNNNPSRNII
ncbi:hypothetical protein BCR32DRAFT_294346 [Anaeromyces robustus]|uniref:G-protein coupled receptors family 3 profile domain-containing protein n=1 Tax=Anaeromyces robustus TaxID=1754192 RepID=A0A1Y1X2N7_9FUNG|nr:hypothetical protein BCR32DRAFT_294346 [Anaeromyces robustus]|eukprot:ORX79594.1 hypothetical protein BCR32DRAFT_294346 [Anaeromyces robustus]